MHEMKVPARHIESTAGATDARHPRDETRTKAHLVLTSMLYASRPDVNGERLMNAVRKFLDDTRGAVLVEYSVVVGAVGIVSMLTFVALGIALANDFRFLRSNLFMPYP